MTLQNSNSSRGRNPISRTSKSSIIAKGAILTTLALIFTYVEFLIPYSTGIPGVKLGLANLVIIFAVYHMGAKESLTINLVRILIAGLLFSGLFGAMYSLAGGLLSLAVMLLLKKTGVFSMIGVSMAGGVFHNLGQLLIASFLVSNLKMFVYFPILLFSGLASGIAIGIAAYIIDKKIPQHLKG